MIRAALGQTPSRPALTLASALVAVVFAATRLFDPVTLAPRFDVDPSMAALLPGEGEALATFERAQRQFGDDDVLLVAWLTEDLFSVSRLAGLKRLTRRIERLPNVAAVSSFATALDLRAGEDETVVAPFLRDLPSDAAHAERLRTRATANPMIAGRLVSTDGRGALLAVRFEPGLDTRTLLDRVAQITDASQEEAGDAEQFLSGPLLVRLEISRILLRDLYRVMPLAVFATLLVATLAFRSVRGVVLPTVANGAAVTIALAIFVEAGHGLNFVTVILPPVIYVVGYAYSIHVVSAFDRRYVSGSDRRLAAGDAVDETLAPLTLTAVTTAIAFAALGLSSLDSIRVFGLYASLGVMLAWLAALTIVPAGLALMPGRARPPAEQRAVAGAAARLSRFYAGKRAGVLVTGAAVALVAVIAAGSITVDTAVLRNFDEASSVQRDFERIATVFSGPVPIRILIESDASDAFKEPAALRELVALSSWLEAQPEIGGVYTLADYVTMVHRAIAPEDAAAAPIPATGRLVHHFLLLGGGDDVYDFTNAAFSATLLHVGTGALSTAAVNGLAARIQTRLDELPTDLRGSVTGTSSLIAHTVDALTFGQVKSLLVALAVIFVVLSIAFGSARIGAIALVPNALPVAFYFGLLGASGTSLNLTTSLVACAVFGIAIDDSVHFLTRFGIESRQGRPADLAVTNTLAAVLRPVTVTTLALCVGFVALTAGELRSQAEFGLLAGATLLFAWLVDVTFTPALCRGLRIVPAWDRLLTRR